MRKIRAKAGGILEKRIMVLGNIHEDFGRFITLSR